MPWELDYFESWEASRSRRVLMVPAITAGGIVLFNAALPLIALLSEERGGAAFFLSPIANLALLIVALCLIPLAKRIGSGASAIAQAAIAVVIPVVATLANVLVLGWIVFPHGIPRC